MNKFVIQTEKPGHALQVELFEDGGFSWEWLTFTPGSRSWKVKHRNPLSKAAMEELRNEARFWGRPLRNLNTVYRD